VQIFIDGPRGALLATAIAKADGSFQISVTIPVGAAGSHQLVAQQTANGATAQADLAVFVQALPR
jgi:hypothetical protein